MTNKDRPQVEPDTSHQQAKQVISEAQYRYAQNVASQPRKGFYASIHGAQAAWIADRARGNSARQWQIIEEFISLAMILDLAERHAHFVTRRELPPDTGPDLSGLAAGLVLSLFEDLPEDADYGPLLTKLITEEGMSKAAATLYGFWEANRLTHEAVIARQANDLVEEAAKILKNPPAEPEQSL